MIIPKWSDPHRKRKGNAKFTDDDYVRYYDLDLLDFKALVLKLASGNRLTEFENDRYGIYIITISIIVLEGPQFRMKPRIEKEQVIEQMYMELLSKLINFDPSYSSIYPYAYRIAFTAGIHYYKALIRNSKQQKKIQAHLDACLADFKAEISDCKITCD